MLRTFDLQLQHFDPLEPWTGFLAAIAYAIRTTYHTTTKASPAELVFGRDMIFNRSSTANWDAIRRQKQTTIDKNNLRENAKRSDHKYKIGDKVLYLRRLKRKQKHERPYDGPFEVIQCYNDGTYKIKRDDKVKQRTNARLLHPYKT